MIPFSAQYRIRSVATFQSQASTPTIGSRLTAMRRATAVADELTRKSRTSVSTGAW